MKMKLLIVAIIVTVFGAFFYFDLGSYLTLEYIKENQENLQNYYLNNKFLTMGIFFGIYIVATAMSFPGATILTLLGGAIFGLGWGLVLVSFASTIGATLAFLMSRTVLRDTIQNKFGDKLKTFNEGVEREGALYLFTLRLVPIFPFFLINTVMGLTPMTVGKFYIVSQLGMLLGTAVYVNAGDNIKFSNSHRS